MTAEPQTDPGASAVEHDPTPEAPTTRGRPVPFLLLAGVIAALLPGLVAAGAIRDIDLYWHFLVGRDILSGVPLAEAGRGWSFATVPDTWVSTQWLAEVLFARLEDWGGLRAMLWYRQVAFLLTLMVLALVTLRHRPVRASVWAFSAGAITLAMFTQERSQQLTFLMAPLVGWWIERLWRTGRLPRWWVVLPLTVVWANYHGGWVLLPFGLGLAALARLLDHGWRDRAAGKALLLAAGTVAAACVSPSGIGTVLAAPRFASSTAIISEWQKVQLWDWTMLPFGLLLVITVVAWARGRVRPSRGELAIVVLLVLFSLIAWRNVTPALLALAPILTGTIARALGEPDPTTTRPRLLRTSLGLAAVGAALGLVLTALQTPVVDASVPQRMLARIHGLSEPQRVFNNYNVAGPLLWFGGPPPHVLVGIDGRADRYGAEYITAYQDAAAGKPGWRGMVDKLQPTCALLRFDDGLTEILVEQRDWVEVDREGSYVLLHAPGAPGWPR